MTEEELILFIQVAAFEFEEKILDQETAKAIAEKVMSCEKEENND